MTARAVAFAAATLTQARLRGDSLVMATASTAQACTRIVATLLTTQNAVELERFRYLVAELGCSVRGALPVLEAATDAGTGLPHARPPPPAYDLGDMLLTFL